ncbi:MAG TPA: glycine--tRNA ligase subunit beta [Steroidobacteraceae bacterium]|nr:glycine--tRNA ligase subunit beta [Steroidobacteraceae bacterium]
MSAWRDFLVEIGTEELPPKSLSTLSTAFADGVEKGLRDAGLQFKAVERFATPRRLAVRVRRLSERQPDRPLEKRGPPVKAAFDAEGHPTQAALAFARGCGVDVTALERLDTPKGQWLVHRGVEAGASTAALLPGIVVAALDALPVAKRMRWGAGEAQFVRPVHWVVLLFGRDVVDAEILGIRTSNVTCGHRFMAPKPIRLPTPMAYVRSLHERGRVLADVQERRETIRKGVIAAAERIGGVAVVSEALLDEVTGLVEWPVPLAGRFDARFLELPPEVPIATMQDHQRYFPVRDAEGRLMPWFITVSNIESLDPPQVIAGNERVVRPRLSDAEFFYATDRQRRLDSGLEALQRVTFQTQLGSLHQKTERVRALARTIAAGIGGDPQLADRAAQLSKCDLLTSMVGEFPELQGLMGRYYAQHDGEDAEVAEALREQYLPRFAGDALPATRSGMAVSIADKLDTIAGIYATGQKPSGTRDPFGLRRAALGLLRTSIERGLDLDLQQLLARAVAAARSDMEAVAAAQGKGLAPVDLGRLRDEVYDYVIERLRAYYVEGGAGIAVTSEMFDAVLATRPASPLDFDARLRALVQFLQLPDAASLASANKRIANILRKTDEPVGDTVDPQRLIDPAEQILAEQVVAIARLVEPRFAARDYTPGLQQLAALRQAVDDFFDSVMVMTDDAALRSNRLALLNRMRGLFMRAADLSRLPG